MVPGLSGRHTINGLELNKLDVWPRYRLQSIPGFKSLGDLEDARDYPAGMNREVVRRALRRGKAFTYQGVIEARSELELLEAIDDLVYACSPTDEQLISIAPVVAAITAPPVFYYGRITAVDAPEEHPNADKLFTETRGFQRNFAVGVRMSDPRFFAASSSEASSAVISSTSGTALPWTLPVVINAPESSSGAVSIDYLGTAPGDPVVTLTGPATNPGIRSDTRNKQLRFNLTLTAVTDTLVIDFRTRTAILNGTDDVRYLLDREESNWWDDDIGLVPLTVNSLRYIGDSLTDPASATVSYYTSYRS